MGKYLKTRIDFENYKKEIDKKEKATQFGKPNGYPCTVHTWRIERRLLGVDCTPQITYQHSFEYPKKGPVL